MRNMKELTKEEMRKFIERSMIEFKVNGGKVTRSERILGEGLLSSNTAVPKSSSSKMRLGKLSRKLSTAETGMRLKVM